MGCWIECHDIIYRLQTLKISHEGPLLSSHLDHVDRRGSDVHGAVRGDMSASSSPPTIKDSKAGMDVRSAAHLPGGRGSFPGVAAASAGILEIQRFWSRNKGVFPSPTHEPARRTWCPHRC